jgi:LysR family transcriptional activator of nhaA
MKHAPLNFNHLHYFWITAQEGSFTRAAERLGLAVQTVSVQIAALEKSLGRALLAPQGRRLVPTEAGRRVLEHADRIFQLGERLVESVADDVSGVGMRLTVGISDSVPKLIAYRLLSKATGLAEPVRLVCREGQFDDLLAALALHRLDVVLTDRPAATGGGLKVYSHSLGDCDIALFGTPALAKRYGRNFPKSLDGAPLLLPTRNTALRGRIDQWLATQDLRPAIMGEFEDGALMQTFGRTGFGLFPAPAVLAPDIAEQFGARPLGEIPEVREQFYAISAERRISHPAVEAIRQASIART